MYFNCRLSSTETLFSNTQHVWLTGADCGTGIHISLLLMLNRKVAKKKFLSFEHTDVILAACFDVSMLTQGDCRPPGETPWASTTHKLGYDNDTCMLHSRHS